MKIFLLFLIVLAMTISGNSQTVTDIDGNIYTTVTIGNQTWMKENLKTTKYRNGDLIPNVINGVTWSNLTTGAYCDYNNTPSNITLYGKLYNFYTVVDSRNVCPTGWHIPSDIEWTTLTTYLGGENVAGDKLKDTIIWNSTVTIPTNESGFSALPGGQRKNTGEFSHIGAYGFWWCSSEVWGRSIGYNISFVSRSDLSKVYGYSLRCVKDTASSVIIANMVTDEINIYPNPSKDKLYLKNIKTYNSFVYIFDLQGKQIFKTQIASNSIDISNLLIV
jgi:uncharacterized protein (TIGR02145 family)